MALIITTFQYQVYVVNIHCLSEKLFSTTWLRIWLQQESPPGQGVPHLWTGGYSISGWGVPIQHGHLSGGGGLFELRVLDRFGLSIKGWVNNPDLSSPTTPPPKTVVSWLVKHRDHLEPHFWGVSLEFCWCSFLYHLLAVDFSDSPLVWFLLTLLSCPACHCNGNPCICAWW